MLLLLLLMTICHIVLGIITPQYVMNTLSTPVTINAYDSFGVSVSIKDNKIAVGADVGGMSSQGVVHTFIKDGSNFWTHDDEFLAHDGVDGDRYGNSVVVYDEWLFIGAFLQDRSGKVYVYRHDGNVWSNHSELLPLVRVRDGFFGHRVRAKNYTLAVSHPAAKVEHELESGNVNIYNNWGLNWVLGNILTPAVPVDKALHGYSVDFTRGDQMVVGAPKEGTTGVGYIYLFDDHRWNVLNRVVGLSGAEFGHAVAMDYKHVAITSRVGGPTGNGYVVTFRNNTEENTWEQSSIILTGDVVTSEGTGTSFYGNDVALYGDIMVVGAPFEGATGAIYVYHWWDDGIGWHRHHKIVGPTPADNDWYHSMFGWSIDMHNDILIVGSPGALTLDGTKRAGSVFIFTDFVFNRPPTQAPVTLSPTSSTIPTTAPTLSPIIIVPAPTDISTISPTTTSSTLSYMINSNIIVLIICGTLFCY